jgi:hypothetical protein
VQFQTLMLSTVFTGILGVMGFHALKVRLILCLSQFNWQDRDQAGGSHLCKQGIIVGLIWTSMPDGASRLNEYRVHTHTHPSLHHLYAMQAAGLFSADVAELPSAREAGRMLRNPRV